jgi:hypothetical protein
VTAETDAALLAAIEGLRSDMREDLGGLRDDLQTYMTTHGADHQAADRESADAHGRFDTFIRNAEIAAARRDGALGVVRFLFELFSRHSPALVRVAVAVAAAALVVSGNVHVSIQ